MNYILAWQNLVVKEIYADVWLQYIEASNLPTADVQANAPNNVACVTVTLQSELHWFVQ